MTDNVRLGVKLTPMQTAVFDRIAEAGERGITYKEFGVTSDQLSSHVNNINVRLEETDYKISANNVKAWGPRPYVLRKTLK